LSIHCAKKKGVRSERHVLPQGEGVPGGKKTGGESRFSDFLGDGGRGGGTMRSDFLSRGHPVRRERKGGEGGTTVLESA